MRYKIVTVPLLLLPLKFLHKLMYKVCTSEDKSKKDYLIEYCAIIHNYRKVIYDYNIVFPAKKIKFEGKEYSIFNDVDKYLTQVYGNYMELPPKDKQVAHKPIYLDFNHGDNLNTKEEYNKLNKK